MTGHLSSKIYVFRNNREQIPNNLYSFLVCGSAFGKSAFYRLFLNAIGKCSLSDETHFDTSFDDQSSSTDTIDTRHLINEMSRGGLLTELSENNKILLLDEADGCLKRNGLIPDASISEHNNVYELILTLYSGKTTVTKSLTNSRKSLFLQKLNILANTTEEPIIRLLKRKRSGDVSNPFAERSLFLFVSTPLTLEQPFPPVWNYESEPTIEQIAVTCSLLKNLHFYYGTTARLMTISYGNLLCKLMIKNEKIDKWLTARLGKSREHIHRIAVNLQLIHLTFDLIDQYKSEFGSLKEESGLSIFKQRMEQIVKNFLGRENEKITVKLEIRLSVANSAVRMLNILLHQYLCIFCGKNIILDAGGLETTKHTICSSTEEITTATILAAYEELTPHEKSIYDLARAILLHNEIAFTKTTLSRCIPLWKRSTNYHEAAIELLTNKNLIINFEKAAKQSTTGRSLHILLKCVPKSYDSNHIEEFQQLLIEFNIGWESFKRTLCRLQPPVGVIISAALAGILKNPQYQLFINFDVDALTKVSLDNVSDQLVMSSEDSSSSVLNIPQSNSTTTTPSIASISIILPTTSVVSDVPIQLAETTTSFQLPRPKNVTAKRTKQTMVNKAYIDKNS
ncbi:unnamed protein product [Adineta steineri]|uniref:Uncharacterized protein n=1 Tax=Adineta steineri TaxID=433720 RepID=A0A816D665_9BILA|nr:unnamed protein product [Adineta steineri]CAF1630798.1 unnamed protein product [Adineta steineri]